MKPELISIPIASAPETAVEQTDALPVVEEYVAKSGTKVGEWDCYYRKDGNIYFTDGTYIEGVDSGTFIDLTHAPAWFACYGKDARHIYLDAKVISGADTATFVGSMIAPDSKDKNHVYWNGAVLPWADPATFELVWYSKPGPTLFYANKGSLVRYRGGRTEEGNIASNGTFEPIANSDSATFKNILAGYDYAPWSKDKNQVYCQGDVVVGAESESAEVSDDIAANLEVRINGVDSVLGPNCVPVR